MKIALMYVGVVALLLCGPTLFGQITINQSDVPINVGNVSRSTPMSSFPPPNLDWDALSSGSGGGHTWDFSSVTFDFGAYTSTIIAANTAPSNSRFPGATKAWRTDFTTSWTYFSTPSNQVVHHGSITTYGIAPDTIAIVYDAPYVVTQFPVNSSSNWISKWQYSLQTFNNDSLLYTSTTKDSIRWVCDAWGTIKYKTRQAAALRLKGTMYITSTINYAFPGVPPVVTTSTVDHIQFMTLDYNGGGVYVTRNITQGGTFYSGSADYRFVQATTPVYEVSGASLPSDFSVEQNSPNPFNPETSIQYALPKSAEVSFDVFNVIGQTVWSENFGYQAAGAYEVRWQGRSSANEILPSGVYFYRLTAGEHSVTKKMLLLK